MNQHATEPATAAFAHCLHNRLTPLHATQEWRKSSFRQRNLLLKTIVKYIVENQDTICRSGLISECAMLQLAISFLQVDNETSYPGTNGTVMVRTWASP